MARIASSAALASLIFLGACANPHVPDFMVEGRLPDFAGKEAHGAPQTPAPAVTEAPQPPVSRTSSSKMSSDQAPASPSIPVNPSVAAALPAPQPAAAPPSLPAPQPAPAPLTASAPVAAAARPAKSAKAPPPVIAGGFADVSDKHLIKTVSEFAMNAAPNGYLLKSVKSVQSQIVAGTNYELCLRVRTPGHEASWIRQRLVKAVVWQHLDQTMELTSWNEVETCP